MDVADDDPQAARGYIANVVGGRGHNGVGANGKLVCSPIGQIGALCLIQPSHRKGTCRLAVGDGGRHAAVVGGCSTRIGYRGVVLVGDGVDRPVTRAPAAVGAM